MYCCEDILNGSWILECPLEESVIMYMDSLSKDELIKKISTNCIIDKLIQKEYFDAMNYVYIFDKKIIPIKSIWNIMITLYNNKTETKNKELFEKGYSIFEKIVDMYDADEILHEGKIVYSNIHISIRFKSIKFAKKLIDKGLSLKYYHWGKTPLIELIEFIANNKFNKDMLDLLLENGSSIDEFGRDDVVLGHALGYNTFKYLCISGLFVPKERLYNKQILEIIKNIYDFLLEQGKLVKEHSIYKLMNYFDIDYEMPKHCDICMNEKYVELEKLECGHELCIDCAIEIQTNKYITCPFCRKTYDYCENPYKLTITLNTFGRSHKIKVEKETTFYQLYNIAEDFMNNPNIIILHGGYQLPKNTLTLKDGKIKNNSIMYCRNTCFMN